MRRLNPDTNELFKRGDWRDDGFRFWGYSKKLSKKTGLCIEFWRSPEAYEIECKKICDYNSKLQKRPEMQPVRNHYSNLRRSEKLQRTPPWLTAEHLEAIKEVYRKAKALSDFSGVNHDVDHITPLKGKKVSGLHVPWNLRVITASENRKKHNKHYEENRPTSLPTTNGRKSKNTPKHRTLHGAGAREDCDGSHHHIGE